MSIQRYLFLLPPLSGVLLGFAFNVSLAWPFVFVALIPLLLYLARVQEKRNVWHAFAGGFFCGLVFFGSVLFWFFDSHPLDWAGVSDPQTSLIFVSIAWAVSVITLALFTGAWAAAFHLFRQGRSFDIVLGAALWVVFEWLRTFGFSLISYGAGTFWGAHWTFGNLGYTLTGSPFLPLASLGGMYLLSFFIVAVNIVCFLWMKTSFAFSKQGAMTTFVIIFVLLGVCIGAGLSSSRSGPTVSLALLHTNFSSHFTVSAKEAREHKNTFLSLLSDVANQHQRPDVVIFPEDTRFLASFVPTDRSALLQNVSQGYPMTFIDSSRTTINGQVFGILSYYDEVGRGVGEYKKLLMVPHGEYLPYFTGGLTRTFGDSAWADAFVNNREYTTGDGTVVVRTRQGNFGSLFCSEILSDVLYGTLAQDGADILVNNASLSFAHTSPLLAFQTKQQAQMRAAETGKFFVRSANAASALVIAPDGAVVAESARNTGILYANVSRIQIQTLFTRIGNWTLVLSLIICVYGIARQRQGAGQDGGGIRRP